MLPTTSGIWPYWQLARRVLSAFACITALLESRKALGASPRLLAEGARRGSGYWFWSSSENTKELTAEQLHVRELFYVGILGLGTLLIVIVAVRVKLTKSNQGCRSVLCCTAENAPQEGFVIVSQEKWATQNSGVMGEQASELQAFEVWMEEKAKTVETLNEARLIRRRGLLIGVFVAYISASMVIPWRHMHSVSCSNGFFWETHMEFAIVFMLTKFVELHLYASDPTIIGDLPLGRFLFLFASSFFGYADGYMDWSATLIAHSCQHELAQRLAFWMCLTFMLGVVLLQWVVVASLAAQETSQACLMKMVHMDMLANCITIPEESQCLWRLIHMVRTFGEDCWQAALQGLYVVYVKENYFMIASVIMGLCSSLKAMYDAFLRARVALGDYHEFKKSREETIEGGNADVDRTTYIDIAEDKHEYRRAHANHEEYPSDFEVAHSRTAMPSYADHNRERTSSTEALTFIRANARSRFHSGETDVPSPRVSDRDSVGGRVTHVAGLSDDSIRNVPGMIRPFTSPAPVSND